MYGGVPDFPQGFPDVDAHLKELQSLVKLGEEASLFNPGKRKRLNLVGILVGLVVGPIMFYCVLEVLSSEYRFHNPKKAIAYWSLSLIAVALVASMGCAHDRARDREPTWYGVILLTMLTAIISGSIAGDYLYINFMLPYFDMTSLNEYPNVNVASELGDSYLDAGFVGFSDGSQLDFEKPGSYRHGDVFCVVPIINTKVNQGVPKTGQYDFWAVGKNCCNTPPKVFRCGDYHDPATRSGLREINLQDRQYYLHAVQQAMSTYEISSQYPMFFQWVKDPVEIANAFAIEGLQWYRICLFGYIVVNTLIVGIALVFFGRLGYLKRAYEDAQKNHIADE